MKTAQNRKQEKRIASGIKCEMAHQAITGQQTITGISKYFNCSRTTVHEQKKRSPDTGKEMTLVEISGVTKTYWLDSVEVPALTNISLSIKANRFTVIAGPSGSGKTTLLNLIGCIDSPEQGEISIDGQNVGVMSDDMKSDFRARSLGYVFQTFNLLPVLTAYENIEYPLCMAKIQKPERQRRVFELLDAVGLSGKEYNKPSQLSGGQRQRVAIARALAISPKLVLADEPTANLDSQTGKSIIALMRKLQVEQRTSFIFSSHDPQLLAAADDVFHIQDGRLMSSNQREIALGNS